MFFNEKKLTQAIGIALTGSALSLAVMSDASASATTMYNLTTKGGQDFSSNTTVCAPCNGGLGTDGWVHGFRGTSNGTDTSVAKWAGTTGVNKTPFGYTGAILHWAVHFTDLGTAEISSQDSLTRYGVAADIDTAKGAWSDQAEPGAGGWRHDLDYGLFKSDVSGTVVLNVQGINQANTNFGFTIFKGMNTGLTYGHHGDWNFNTNANGLTPSSVPGGGTTFTVADIVAYSAGGTNPQNLNTISFDAEAGQIYTIALGGYKNGDWIDTADGYKLAANVNAVPVPGAIWLFGSAVVGFVGFKRRSK